MNRDCCFFRQAFTNGFEMEGFLHNAVIKDGTVNNLCIYGLLKDAT